MAGLLRLGMEFISARGPYFIEYGHRRFCLFCFKGCCQLRETLSNADDIIGLTNFMGAEETTPMNASKAIGTAGVIKPRKSY